MQNQIQFPEFTGIRCLMMPFIQGDQESLPDDIRKQYGDIIDATFLEKGEMGYLTIDESFVSANNAQRAYRSKHGRALHTEGGKREKLYAWGGGFGWGRKDHVILERDLEILIASNIGGTTAYWDDIVEDTTNDGDIGHLAHLYPYNAANFLQAGEVAKLSILTPHESIPVKQDCNRQFIRIVGHKLEGREPYFTQNPKML